jgi:ribosomal protein S18 acetylase RimI-like enzyme
VEVRDFEDATDLARMQRLVAECWRRDGPFVTVHVGDLPWRLYQHLDKLAEVEIRLWLDGDECRAWGWRWLRFETRDIDFVVHPDAPELHDELLAWAGESPVWTLEERAQPLLERGWEPQEMTFEHLVRELADLPPVRVPQGFTVRSVRGTEDLDARVEVHRAVWAPSRVVRESYRAVMAAPPYRRELDVVVEAPDGRFAAYCLCWLDEENRVGLYEPVGTHPDFRRLGLGAAACLEGLHRLRAAGADRCVVYPGTGKPAAEFYEALGFRSIARHRAFRPTAGKGTPRTDVL